MRKLFPVSMMIVLVTVSCSSTVQKSNSESVYNDGTYIGEESNWPSMIVEVTIENDRIQDIRFIESNGTPSYTNQVIPELPNRIMEAGNLNVDGITTASLSSGSFVNAMKVAMGKARK